MTLLHGLREAMVRLIAARPGPVEQRAEAVVRDSRRLRQRTRPVIERAHRLAIAYERGDAVMRKR